MKFTERNQKENVPIIQTSEFPEKVLDFRIVVLIRSPSRMTIGALNSQKL